MNSIQNEFAKALPKDVLLKYGWVVLITPAIYYAIDKMYDFAEQAMANDYNLSINVKGVGVNLTKCSCEV